MAAPAPARRRRDLYKFAGEVTVPDHMHASWARVRPADIVSKAPSGSALRECDVIVDNKEINYSMKARELHPRAHPLPDPAVHRTCARARARARVGRVPP